MAFINEKIRELVTDAAKKAFSQWDGKVKIEYPAQEIYGDYSASVAFEIGKVQKINPVDVAKKIIKAIKLPKWISKVESAGGAFINFYLAPEFLSESTEEIIKMGEKFGTVDMYKGKTVVTDTSHPNVAKPMGVHHLLSTIIGNAINRLLVAVGYKVIRDNYLGDWGTQFGKLIYAYKKWGNEKTVKADPIPELLKLYVQFHDEAEKDAKIEDFGRLEFKKLEEGDSQNRKLWQWIVDLSLVEFQKIWKRLGVNFDYIHGESFYEDKMQAIIDLGIKKKIFVEGEGGALIAPFAHGKYPPCIIKKSDGATLYATRDLARTKYWEDTWHPDLMVMVVDIAQSLHFQQFFEVAYALGITKAPNVHVSFGRMKFPEKKMSTRKGNIVLLENLLDESEERAYKIVCEKNPDLDEKKKREVARMVGVGSVKYAVLSQNRNTDVTFTWDKMLSLDGNSAPYLQYVYARARAILRKSTKPEIRNPKTRNPKKCVLKKPQEILLARMLPKFPEIVLKAAQEYKPNVLAGYLFELATKFNSFYGSVPVLQAKPDVRIARLSLVAAVCVVLKNGLTLLGIEAPEEM